MEEHGVGIGLPLSYKAECWLLQAPSRYIFILMAEKGNFNIITGSATSEGETPLTSSRECLYADGTMK